MIFYHAAWLRGGEAGRTDCRITKIAGLRVQVAEAYATLCTAEGPSARNVGPSTIPQDMRILDAIKFGAASWVLLSDFPHPMGMSASLATRIGLLCAGNQHSHKAG